MVAAEGTPLPPDQRQRASWRPPPKAPAGSSASAEPSGRSANGKEKAGTGAKEQASRKLQKHETCEDVPASRDKAPAPAAAAGGEASAAPTHRPTRRGRRRRNPEKKKELKIDKDMKGLRILLLKQVLMNTQSQRTLTACVVDKFQVPSSSPLITSMTAEGQSFAAMVADLQSRRDQGDEAARKELTGLGPPTPAIFTAFLETLTQREIGKKSRSDLLELLNKIEPETEMEDATVSRTDLMDKITICRIESVHDPSSKMISIAMRGFAYRDAILTAMNNLDLPPKRGTAPAGYIEEELSAWIDALE